MSDENFNAAVQDLNLSPQEQGLYRHHLYELDKGGVQNDDGSISTVRNITVEQNDRTYSIPTVWDGQILSNQDAINRAFQNGSEAWPSYASEQEADDRYNAIHGYMEKDLPQPAPEQQGPPLPPVQPNSPLTKPAEDMLLDFNGWLGKQDTDRKGVIQKMLDLTPDAQREAQKQHIASVFAVADARGVDPAAVDQNWDVARTQFANEMGGDWAEAGKTSDAFFARLAKQAQFSKDERQILTGPGDDDPKFGKIMPLPGDATMPGKDGTQPYQMGVADAPRLRQQSLVGRAEEAAYKGRSFGDALGDWQSAFKDSPGYDPARAPIYEAVAKSAYDQTAAMMAKVRPLALQVYSSLAADRGAAVFSQQFKDTLPPPDTKNPAAPFRGLSVSEKEMGFRMMTDMADTLTDKSNLQMVGEAIGRSFENMVGGAGTAAWRNRLATANFQPGQQVHSDDPISELNGAYAAESISRSGANSAMPSFYAQPTHQLSVNEAAWWNERTSQELEDLDTLNSLRKFGQETVDPIGGGAFFRHFILPVADSAATLTAFAVPESWGPAIEMAAGSYQNDEYDRLRAGGASIRDAERMSAVTGLALAVRDKLTFGLLQKGASGVMSAAGMPTLEKTLEQMSLAGRNYSRFALDFGTTIGADTLLLATTNKIIPAIVQDSLKTDPKFDVKWGDVWADVAKSIPETAMGLIIPAGFGALLHTDAQRKASDILIANPEAMRIRGYSLDDIAEIQAAPVEQRRQMLVDLLPDKAPETDEEKKTAQDEALQLWVKKQLDLQAKAKAEATDAADASDYGIAVSRDGDGWKVQKPDGTTVAVSSADAARSIREDLLMASTQQEAEALVSIIDNWHDKTPDDTERKTTLTGAVARSEGNSIVYTQNGRIVREVTNPADLDRLRAEAQMDAQNTGNQDIDVVVNGSNNVEFRDKVADGAKKVAQTLEINQPGSDTSPAVTALHEQVESMWRTMVAKGTFSLADTVRAIAGVAPAFDPKEAKSQSDRMFRERIQRVAQGKGSETDIRETLSELTVGEIIGRRKDGETMPAGSVTAAIKGMLDHATDPADVKAVGKFRAMIRAVRQYFRAMFSTVAALKRAKGQGLGGDFRAMVDKIVGLDTQRVHENGAANEAESIANEHLADYVPPSADEQASGIAFSLSRPQPSDGPRPPGASVGRVDDLQHGDVVFINGKQRTVSRVSRRFVYEKIGNGSGVSGRVARGDEPGLEYKRGVNAPVWLDFPDGSGILHLGNDSIYRDRRSSNLRRIQDSGAKSAPAQTQASDVQSSAAETPEGEIHFADGVTLRASHPLGTTYSVQSRKTLPGDYPDSLEKTITSTRVGSLTKHPDYEAAKKHGDGEAGYKVVTDTLKDSAVDTLRNIIAGREVTFVPVVHQDTGRRLNAIPLALANELAHRLGGAATTDILKVSGRANTGASVESRFANEQSFDGPVTKGGLYVVVDDNHTSGDTLTALIDHIKENGGEVIAATALAASQSGNYLRPRAQDAAKLLDATGLDEASFQREFGVSIKALTGSEIYRLANLGPRGWDAARFREYVRSRISEGAGAPDHGASGRSTGESGSGGQVGFSLSPGSRLELIAKRVEAALANDPEKRREIGLEMARRLRAMASDWDTTRYTPKGDEIRPLVEPRTAKSLDDERNFRQAARREELEAEVFGRHEHILSNPELAKLWMAGPVMEALSVPNSPLHGRLKSATESQHAEWFNRKAADYDGADGIPPVVFGGTMAPDQMAQELFDQGLIPQPTPDAMWEAIRKEVASSVRWKEYLGKAKDELKQAREQAAKEADAWRAQQDDIQAKDHSPRAKLVRDLRTLDAIVSVLPAEIRGKVGGFVNLALLGTDKSREAELGRRIEKAGDLVEGYLKKENQGSLDTLLAKAEPKGGPGEKAGGKIAVAGHRVFAEVEKVRGLTDDEVTAKRAELDAAVDAELQKPAPDIQKIGDLYERRQILEAFGNYDGKNAVDGDTALKWLKEVYTTGRNAWRSIVEQREQERADLRAQAIKEVGGPGEARERQVAREAEGKAGQFGWLRNFLGRAQQSWSQRIGSIFGTNSKTAEHYEKGVHDAFQTKADRLNQRREAQRAALLKIFGEKSWWKVQDKLLELQQRRDKSGVFKLEGRKTETLTLPVDKAQDILDGKVDASAFGVKKEHFGALQAALDTWAATGDKAHSVSIDVVRNEGKPVEQLLSQLEAVHLTMLARQEGYRAGMDYHGWTAESLGQMEKFLSPQAKMIRDWLHSQYEQGYGAMNRVYQQMYGIDLPKVENYAPGYFEHAGNAGDMNPFGLDNDPAGMAAGFLRQRKNHKAEPVIMDALQTYWNHALMTEHWQAFAPFIQEMRSVFGSVDVKHAVSAHEGGQAYSDVMNWVKIFEQNGIKDAQSNRWVGRVSTALARSGLGFRLGTLMKHLPNAFASLAEVPTMKFMRGLFRVASGQSEASLSTIWKSDTIRNRLLASYTPDLRQIMQGPNARAGWLARVGNFLDWGVSRISWVASAFTTFSAAVAYDHHFQEAIDGGMDRDSAKLYAEEKTALTIARTSQPESLDRKSLAEIERTGAARLMMMFHTPERQQWGVAFSAMADAINGKTNKGDAMRKLVATWLVSPVLMQTMVGLYRYMTTDDDAEEAWTWKRYLGAIALGPLSGIFGLGQIAEATVQHFTGAQGSKAGDVFTDMGSKLLTAGKHATDGDLQFKDVLEFLAAAGVLTGAATDYPAEALKTLKNFYDQGHGIISSKEDLHDEKHAGRHHQ